MKKGDEKLSKKHYHGVQQFSSENYKIKLDVSDDQFFDGPFDKPIKLLTIHSYKLRHALHLSIFTN